MSDRRQQKRREGILPHSLEAEKACLGSLLIENAGYDQVSGHLDAKMFFREAHRQIYAAMTEILGEGLPLDTTSLILRLEGKTTSGGETQLENCGGPVYLGSLIDGMPRSTNIAYYAQEVRAAWTKRRLIDVGKELIDAGYAPLTSPQEAMHATAARMADLAAQARLNVGTRSIAAAMPAVMAEFDRRAARRGQLAGYTSGFPKIDAMTHGWQPGMMTVIGAKTHVGKSTLALNFAKSLLEVGQRVVYYSYEMPLQTIIDRLLASISEIHADRITWWNLSEAEQKAIGQWLDVLHDWPLHVNDVNGRTMREISAECRQIQRDGGLGGVFIDHFQLMKGVSEHSRLEELEAISRECKELAVELQVPLFVVSQLTTDKTERKKRPSLDDLRWCKALGHDCDFGFILHPHDPDDLEKDKEIVPMQFWCLKNRPYGRLGLVTMNLERDFVRFVEADPPAKEAPAPKKEPSAKKTPLKW